MSTDTTPTDADDDAPDPGPVTPDQLPAEAPPQSEAGERAACGDVKEEVKRDDTAPTPDAEARSASPASSTPSAPLAMDSVTTPTPTPTPLTLGFAASATRSISQPGQQQPANAQGFAALATNCVCESCPPVPTATEAAADAAASSTATLPRDPTTLNHASLANEVTPPPSSLPNLGRGHDGSGGDAPLPSSLAGRLLHAVEKYAVALVLIAMGVLPTAESISRLVFNEGIPGALTYTRHFTLWIGFLGALLATGQGRHLALAIGEFIHGPAKKVVDLYVGILSTVICALLAYAAFVMVRLEPSDRLLPGGIPEWWSVAIMPLTLFLMALRFAWRSSDKLALRALALTLFAAVFCLGLLQLHADAALTLPFVSPDTRSFAVLTFLETHAASLVLPGAILILLGLVLGAPLFIGMSGLAMLLFFGESTPIASVPSETYRLVQNAALPAIPILTAAGYVLAEGGASKRLLRVAKAFMGWAPGGLALMIVIVLAGFTAFTGGSGVTILALGGLVMPMLIAEKYPKGMSLGLVTSSGSLGLLFPPSLPVILYSVVAGVGMEDLFIAGLLPGLLLVVLVAAVGVVVGIRYKAPIQPFSLREAGAALWEAKWELAIPFIVLAAIFTGFATLVEAAALAFLLALFAECVLFRDLHWRKQLPETLARAGTLIGAVIILLGMAMGLTSYLVDAEIPAKALEWTQRHIQSPWLFLLALNAVLLVLGSVLEIYAAIAILAPLLVPMAEAYGIAPVHLGIVFLANLELGFLFPPVGINLILSSTRFGEPLTRLYKVALPFLIIMAIGVLVTTYIPAMTTGFLAFVKGG